MRHATGCAVLVLLFAGSTHAQTMFRCQDGNRTVYSDRPCWSGTEVKRMTPTGAPTPEQVAKAQMKARDQDRASGKPQPVPDVPATLAKRDPAVPAPSGKPASVGR